MSDTISHGEYVNLFERWWRDTGDDLVLRINDWDVIRTEDNDTDRDSHTWFDDELTKLISELTTAKRRLREHLNKQGT